MSHEVITCIHCESAWSTSNNYTSFNCAQRDNINAFHAWLETIDETRYKIWFCLTKEDFENVQKRQEELQYVIKGDLTITCKRCGSEIGMVDSVREFFICTLYKDKIKAFVFNDKSEGGRKQISLVIKESLECLGHAKEVHHQMILKMKGNSWNSNWCKEIEDNDDEYSEEGKDGDSGTDDGKNKMMSKEKNSNINNKNNNNKKDTMGDGPREEGKETNDGGKPGDEWDAMDLNNKLFDTIKNIRTHAWYNLIDFDCPKKEEEENGNNDKMWIDN